MELKTFFTIVISCLIGTCGGTDQHPESQTLASIETQGGPAFEKPLHAPFGQSISGKYLASQFAQRHHDWQKAGEYLSDVLIVTPENPELLKRGMVLAMGAGDVEKALRLARHVDALEDKSTLALMFLSVGAFHDQEYDQAIQHIKDMPKGSLSDFIMPLLGSWAQAAVGKNATQDLDKNTVHIYHAIMIADYLKQYDEIEKLLKRALKRNPATDHEYEEIADIYAHIGQHEQALKYYGKILENTPNHITAKQKVSTLESGEPLKLFKTIDTPEEGLAQALNDMAQLLYKENSDDSARVFTQMGLYLDPDMPEAHLLLAAIHSRNERYQDAIAHYHRIGPEEQIYLEAQRRAAELLEDTGQTERAIARLKILADEHNDIEAVIKIGDIHRRQKNFDQALTYYNKAADKFDSGIPAEFWHLYYVRGMSYEQAGNWDKAEFDLKAALEYQPDHPYVLNYLGYAWADQGINLSQSLELIRRAIALQPTDGYITDSLGWVHYRLGQFEQSVPHLEKAVELLPYDPVINDHLGDAYWQVGRKMEARFQWQRARNFSEDETMISTLELKLENGIEAPEVLVNEARVATEGNPKQ